ncbi:MAG: hypothetical protein AAB383_04885 [Patescibacteria group bacterium]
MQVPRELSHFRPYFGEKCTGEERHLVSLLGSTFSDLQAFMDHLRKIDVHPCAKMHENPNGEIHQNRCPVRAMNACCAHQQEWQLEGDRAVWHLLDGAIVLAYHFHLLSLQERRTLEVRKSVATGTLVATDLKASIHYFNVSGPNEAPVTNASIRTTELAAGRELLAIRDELLVLFEGEVSKYRL